MESDVGLQERVVRLEQENAELQDYAERVTRELRRYQRARPKPPAAPEDDMPLPPWAANLQTMAPLLFAYEERIHELEGVIDGSVSLAEQVQALTKENDTLRTELHERTGQLRNAQLTAPARDPARDGDQADEVRGLYELSKEQNEVLAQSNQVLKLQMEKMHQTLMATQVQYQQLQARFVEANRGANVEVETAKRTKEGLEARDRRVNVLKDELVEATEMREQLGRQVEGMTSKLQSQKRSLDFYKQTLDERREKEEDVESRYQVDMGRRSQIEQDLRQKVDELEHKYRKAQEKVLESRAKEVVLDNQGNSLMQDCNKYFHKFKVVQEENDRLYHELCETSSHLSESEIQKETLTCTEQSLERQVARLEARMQKDLDTLTRTRDIEAAGLRSSHQRAVEDLEERLRNSEFEATELATQAELEARRAAWNSEDRERAGKRYDLAIERMQVDLDEAHEEKSHIEGLRAAAAKEGERLRKELELATSSLRKESAAARQAAAASGGKAQGMEAELRVAGDEMRVVEDRERAAAAECARLQGALKDECAAARDAADKERDAAEAARRALQRSMQAAEADASAYKKRATDLVARQEVLQQRVVEELRAEKDKSEKTVDRLQRENTHLMAAKDNFVKALKSMRPRTEAGDCVLCGVRAEV